MRIFAANFDSKFFRELCHFEPRNLTKIKYTERACQHNSSETDQQIFMKLCSYEGHTV